jgi:hypothetical protein
MWPSPAKTVYEADRTVLLGKPVLIITLIVNFQGEKRVWRREWSMEHGEILSNCELRNWEPTCGTERSAASAKK